VLNLLVLVLLEIIMLLLSLVKEQIVVVQSLGVNSQIQSGLFSLKPSFSLQFLPLLQQHQDLSNVEQVSLLLLVSLIVFKSSCSQILTLDLLWLHTGSSIDIWGVGRGGKLRANWAGCDLHIEHLGRQVILLLNFDYGVHFLLDLLFISLLWLLLLSLLLKLLMLIVLLIEELLLLLTHHSVHLLLEHNRVRNVDGGEEGLLVREHSEGVGLGLEVLQLVSLQFLHVGLKHRVAGTLQREEEVVHALH